MDECEEMNKNTLRILAVSATCFGLNHVQAADVMVTTAGGASATTATTPPSTTTTTTRDRTQAVAAVPASRIASRFETLAGSPENAASLVAGLRSGSEVTLTSPDSTTGTSFTPSTRPMGYGNITRALSLAQRQLAAQGITRPTPEQLNIALNGGSMTTIDGSGASRTVDVPGVLQLRSQGMGWGQIAHQLSVNPGYRPARTTTGTAASTQESTRLHGSYGRGAIVSGDGTVIHSRASGHSGAGETRGRSSAGDQANGRTVTHPNAAVIQTGSSASFGGGHAPGVAGNHGRSTGQTHSHGRT
jgi:hypothetical protein